MFDLAREHDDQAAQRVSRREHAVDAGKRIEAPEPDLRLIGQALDRIVHVAKLEVLRQEQLVPAERPSDREPRLEATQPEALAQPRQEVARPDLPFVCSAPRAKLHHAGRKATVLCGKGVGEHLDRFETLPRQFEVEVTGRWVDEAGAADLERTLRGLSALGAQPSIRTSQDTRQQRKETLEVVAFQRRDVEDRAGKHVARRNGLHALRRRRRRPHLDIGRGECQIQVEQYLRGFSAAHVKRRGCCRDEARTRRLDDVAARRHIRKRHLTCAVRHRLREDRIAIQGPQLHFDGGHTHGALEGGDRGNDAAGAACALKTRRATLRSEVMVRLMS